MAALSSVRAPCGCSSWAPIQGRPLSVAGMSASEQIGLDWVAPVALGLALVAAASATFISKKLGWGPAGALALFAATPLVPHVPLGLGLSLDDVLPLLALAMLGALVPWRKRTPRALLLSWPWAVAFAGLGLMAAAGALSATVHADSAIEWLTLLGRGFGRPALLGALATTVVLTKPRWRRRRVAASALALVGAAEALFGLVAFLLPLPGAAGLEAARKNSVLYGLVAGRIAGTTGLSPDFMGVILASTALLSMGLALDEARPARSRLWLAASGVQVLALALTFTRASLLFFVIAAVVLLLLHRRPTLVVVTVALIVLVGSQSAVGTRFLRETTDRLALWTSAVTIMVDHPLAGVGPGRMLDVASADPARYRETPLGPAVSNAHNAVLLAGAETGVLGALGASLVLVGFALGSIATLWHDRKRDAGILRAAALAALCFVGQSMTNNLLTVGVTSVLGYFIVASFLVDSEARRVWRLRFPRMRSGSENRTL